VGVNPLIVAAERIGKLRWRTQNRQRTNTSFDHGVKAGLRFIFSLFSNSISISET
jgi:hypothetical protein